MKRRIGAAAALLYAGFCSAPLCAQTPLVVGSVRDQHGAPIAGALVTGRTAAGAGAVAVTDAVGTFALRTSDVVAVVIRCRYCATESVPVVPGEPVIAIVRRYDALADETPSPADLQNLPYAHVESSLALRPFTLLAQTSAPYPGSLLSDRGLAQSGSLVVDDGVPTYDVVSGESPYALVPAQFEQSALLRDATNAYAYGDQAAGGIAQLDPFVPDSNLEVATLGSEAIARAQATSGTIAAALASFSNDAQSRQRADASALWALPSNQSIAVTVGSEQGRDYASLASTFAGSFSFADAVFSDPRALNLTISAVNDRGTYDLANYGAPTSEAWSDSGFSAGVHTNGSVAGFADVAVRSSTGFYDAQATDPALPRIGAALDQTRLDAGLAAAARDYAVTAGVGAFWFDYSGGSYGESQPAKTALVLPSLDATLFPNGAWSLELQGSGSFTLPTFVEQYLYAGYAPQPVEVDRNALEAAILNYTDGARVRVSFEAADENVNGAATGKISSVGLAATWQLAPAIALRAWTMHVSSGVPFYGTPEYGIAAPTVGALWFTYDCGAAIRADAIYRRDLLDGLPFYHLDGAISGPLAGALRWYAGAEDRLRRTFVDAGLRFSVR